MIPYFVQPSLHLFGPFTIHGWGVAVCTGILLGTYVAAKRAENLGLDPDVVNDYGVWAVVSGFIGAHVIETLFYETDAFLKNPLELLKVWQGFSSYGGFLGAFVGTLIFRKVRGIRFLDYADSIALGMAPAWMFGRIGCFMAHDHIGKHSDFFLAVKFPDGPRHDLGLYEAILSAGLTLLMMSLRNVKGRGLSAGALIAAYSFVRFFFDFLRIGDSTYAGLTPAQYGTFAFMALGIWMIVRARRELRDDPENAKLRTVTAPVAG